MNPLKLRLHFELTDIAQERKETGVAKERRAIAI